MLKPTLRSITAAEPIFAPGAPELLFGVDAPTPTGDASCQLTAQTTPWTVDGRPSAAGLAIALDDILGAPILARGGPNGWGVTAEMSVDYVQPPHPAPALLSATSHLVRVDDRGGVGHGAIRDDTGAVVALGTQRQWFTADRPTAFDGSAVALPTGTVELPELVGLRRTASGNLEVPLQPWFANPSDNLHGGVTLLLVQLAAVRALRTGQEGMELGSVRIAYLRPARVDGSLLTLGTDVVHVGRSMAVATVTARRADGKAVAIAQVGCQCLGTG